MDGWIPKAGHQDEKNRKGVRYKREILNKPAKSRQ